MNTGSEKTEIKLVGVVHSGNQQGEGAEAGGLGVQVRAGLHFCWSMTQMIECLPSKCEALSSNPSTTKK
jgi:hypothetical protein